MEQYTLRYEGSGDYIGKFSISTQAIAAARGYAKFDGLSVIVTRTKDDEVREVVYHPDGTFTRLWAGER